MEQIQYPAIPREEYKQRWAQVQTFMEETGLDLLIAYANDREVFGQAHARWLFDFPVHLEPVCIIFAREGDPVVATGPESTHFIRNGGVVDDVVVLREFIHPEEVYNLDNVLGIDEVISRKTNGRPVKKVGIAGLNVMDVGTWNALDGFLKTTSWIDVESQVTKLRMVKSEAELTVMRFGYQIAQKAFLAAIDAVEPGKSEMDVAAIVKSTMFMEGAEAFGIEPMIGAGPNASSVLCRSTRRIIQDKDIVRLAIITRYEGYCATIGRPVFVGRVDDEMKKRFDVLCEARQACINTAQAGVRGQDIEGAGRAVLKKYGYEYTYSGVHSIGCKEFETPIFGPGVEGTAVENMMLSIEIPLFHQPWGGLHLEDGIRIAADRAELMHDSQLFIQK